MPAKRRHFLRRWCYRENGGVAIEFAIIIPLFLLLVFGIVDFGHAWYMKHMMSNGSREGARYGTRYATDVLGNRVLPQNLSPSVVNYVKTNWGLVGMLPPDANSNVTLGGPAATETNVSVLAGEDFTVTVTARKNWFVIGKLVPGLGNYKDISVVTTMKCE